MKKIDFFKVNAWSRRDLNLNFYQSPTALSSNQNTQKWSQRYALNFCFLLKKTATEARVRPMAMTP